MRRRRLVLVAVAVAAGAVLVILGNPDRDATRDAAADRRPRISAAPPPPPPPASPAAPAQPAAVAAAEDFARAWVRADEDWWTRLAALATRDLADALIGVDPVGVPARAVTGPGAVVSEVPGWVSVGVPTDAGTVVLHVIAADGGWRVSAVDWRPG